MEFLRHIRMTPAVVENETADKICFCGEFVLHVHNFNHVEV